VNATLTILLMAVVTYLPRLLGFALTGVRVSPFWQRFLRFVPIAVFAALIVPGIPGELGEVWQRSLAAALAALAIWRVRSLWLGILVGMAAFWLLRLL
jgi:branched-subunit amino acid transport protein